MQHTAKFNSETQANEKSEDKPESGIKQGPFMYIRKMAFALERECVWQLRTEDNEEYKINLKA